MESVWTLPLEHRALVNRQLAALEAGVDALTGSWDRA
jgi:hypothetical protein